MKENEVVRSLEAYADKLEAKSQEALDKANAECSETAADARRVGGVRGAGRVALLYVAHYAETRAKWEQVLEFVSELKGLLPLVESGALSGKEALREARERSGSTAEAFDRQTAKYESILSDPGLADEAIHEICFGPRRQAFPHISAAERAGAEARKEMDNDDRRRLREMCRPDRDS